jgi:H+-transporting ATPase
MTSRLSPSAATSPDVVTDSGADAAAAPGVNLSAGLTSAAVEALREAHGYNEVTERPEHPVLRFLSKFWGLSAVLRKHSDLVVVTALLVINAVLSFAQERRAAGAQGIVEQLTRARFFGPIARLELIPLEDPNRRTICLPIP